MHTYYPDYNFSHLSVKYTKRKQLLQGEGPMWSPHDVLKEDKAVLWHKMQHNIDSQVIQEKEVYSEI
jgi:hypothetical protein